jgi:hypothetical protein
MRVSLAPALLASGQREAQSCRVVENSIAAKATNVEGRNFMQHPLKAVLILGALTVALPASAQEEGPPVPVEKAAYHVPVFRNDLIAVLRVNIPSRRSAGYHIHSLDQISVLVEEADQSGQVLGEQPTPPRRNKRGSVTFTAYSKKTLTHRVNNVGPTAFHNIVIALINPQPKGLAPAAREVAGYTQIFDNERARAWRLVLEPGQSAGTITQAAPALRVVLDGGELSESLAGEGDRGMLLRLGDFYWQEPGATRTVRNIGTSRVELVEIEFK